MIEQLHADRALFVAEFLHLAAPEAQLKAGGIHHLREQQRIRRPAAHQMTEHTVADAGQGGLQHAALQPPRRAGPGKLQRSGGEHGHHAADSRERSLAD